jgi:hypothetical protein
MDTHQQAQDEISVSVGRHVWGKRQSTLPINETTIRWLQPLLMLLVGGNCRYPSLCMLSLSLGGKYKLSSNLIVGLEYSLYVDRFNQKAVITVIHLGKSVYTCTTGPELSYLDVTQLMSTLTKMVDNDTSVDSNLEILRKMVECQRDDDPPIILSPTPFWVDMIINTE